MNPDTVTTVDPVTTVDGSSATPTTSPPACATMPALMSACVVVVVAMVAAINLALPKLSASGLRPSSTALLWVVDAYILVFGCLLIPAGALGDRLGRKGVLTAGLGVFAAGSVVSAAATDVAVLLAGRIIAGVGAALVMPATLSLLLQVTPPARKPHAIATWTAATGAAGALGNLGGGVLLEWLPWQALFLVAAPVAVALAATVARVAPRGERHPAALDLVGTAVLTTAVFGLLFGIIEGPTRGWDSPVVLGSFGGAALMSAAFVWHGLRSDHPLLDPRVFAVRSLRHGTAGVAAVFFGLFALFFVNAQYLQYAKGYSPLLTGVAILPLPIGMIVVSRRSIAVASRFGRRQVVAAGMVLVGAGLVALSFADSGTPYLPYAVALLAVSSGMGLSVPSLSTGIMTSLPPERAGMGSGLNSAAREIGAALGIAVVGTVLSSRLGDDAYRSTADAFTDAMASGYRVVAAVVLGAAVLLTGRGR